MIEKTLEWAFDTERLDAVYGWSLADNRAVLMFARRLGFTLLPPLPKFSSKQGKPADAVISYLTADTWRALRHGL
jgi:RimJ/RimL family protein N-acetyltransferase